MQKRSREDPAPRCKEKKGVVAIQTIAFVDFDGTITMEDTFSGAMRLFVDPDEFALYSKKLAAGEATLSEVVRKAYDGASAALLPKMLEYVRGVAMRPGFDTFLDTCSALVIGVVVISGGAREFLDQKLAPYENRLLGIHAAELAVCGDVLHLESSFDDGKELVKKTAVMALYDYDQSIGIGDSFTDCNMAQAVDRVFARDVLAKFLTKKGIPFTPFEDFYTVADTIRSSR